MQTPSHQQRGSFRTLDPDKILETARALHSRVKQRFPASGLCGASNELVLITSEAKERAGLLARPNRWVRAVAVVLGVLLASTCVITLTLGSLRFREVASTLSDLAQGIDAGTHVAILLSAAIYSLVTLEMRMKRSPALKALHELRSLAHIIDLHQLRKDPEIFTGDRDPMIGPANEPGLSAVQVERYLDYCSEMLAILSKAAALYVENCKDAMVLRAVDEVENLVCGLSRKIWQKIKILYRLREIQRRPGQVETDPLHSPTPIRVLTAHAPSGAKANFSSGLNPPKTYE
ncbi:membrane protein [Verrucomicrobiota bacterium]|nr:membrane protein [Verrucomicrobiota bacterium]